MLKRSSLNFPNNDVFEANRVENGGQMFPYLFLFLDDCFFMFCTVLVNLYLLDKYLLSTSEFELKKTNLPSTI